MNNSKLCELIGENQRENLVGYVYQMQYGEANLLVNDSFKFKVSGVPLNTFLVATSIREHYEETPEDEREVYLLRVTGEFELPTDKDMARTIIEKHKRRTNYAITDSRDGLDAVTQGDMQWGGMKCRILGTFYLDSQNNLIFGSDIENFHSASNLRAYKPMGETLSKIVNYCEPARKARMKKDAERLGFKNPPPDVEVGVVRYTSSQRLHKSYKGGNANVSINSGDFLSRRTACFGMTRTGKSNLVKTLIASVNLASAHGKIPIGQLIFDLNGEYANANAQDDGSSIADVFKENTIRYRGIETRGFRDLRNNFYKAIVPGLSILQGLLDSDKLNSSADIRNFIEMSLDEPEKEDGNVNWSEMTRWELRKAIYLTILYRAGFKPPKDFTVKFSVSKNIRDSIIGALTVEQDESEDYVPLDTSHLDKIFYKETDANGCVKLTLEESIEWFLLARDAENKIRKRGVNSGIRTNSGSLWLDGVSRSLLNILAQKSDTDNYIRGNKVLTKFIQYHSSNGSYDVAHDIYNELEKGKIVILDLSVGMPTIRQDMAERISKKIFDVSMSRFTEGGDPPQVVMYVEEAHNLIGKTSELDNTWPRIAKEGAKFKIALVYATQEPSSIHPNILANTENWFVTHLNNDDEINCIGKFYDFTDFGVSLKKAQDVGFARIKTLSSSYVIPTQIKLFDPSAIKKEMGLIGQGNKTLIGEVKDKVKEMKKDVADNNINETTSLQSYLQELNLKGI